MLLRFKRTLAVLICSALLFSFAYAALSFFDMPASYALTAGDWEYTVLDGEATVTKYNGSATDVAVPSEFDGHAVVAIGEKAFYICEKLTSIDIPASVKTIGDRAFFWCRSLTSVALGEGIVTLGSFVFSYCEGLTSADLSACDNLQIIPSYAFYSCATLGAVTLPASLKTVGEGAFDLCSSLGTVNFCGSEETWRKVNTGDGNGALETAKKVFDYGVPAPAPVSPLTLTVNAAKDVIDVGETVEFVVSVSASSVRSGAVTLAVPEPLEIVSGGWIFDSRLADFKAESGSGVFLLDAADNINGEVFAFSLRLKENTAKDYSFSVGLRFADGDSDRGAGSLESKISFGHTPAEAVVENDVPPTCAEKGRFDEVVYCSVCGQELSRKTVTVPEKGHTPDEPTMENDVPPTETEDGHYDSVIYCYDCGEELSRETVAVPALGVKGDLSGDKNVNDADVVYLLYHIFFGDDYPVSQNCDFDGNGAVDDGDAVYLLYHVFFPDDYPLY